MNIYKKITKKPAFQHTPYILHIHMLQYYTVLEVYAKINLWSMRLSASDIEQKYELLPPSGFCLSEDNSNLYQLLFAKMYSNNVGGKQIKLHEMIQSQYEIIPPCLCHQEVNLSHLCHHQNIV